MLIFPSLTSTQSDDQLEHHVHKAFCQFGNCYVKIRRDPSSMPFAFVQYEASNNSIMITLRLTLFRPRLRPSKLSERVAVLPSPAVNAERRLPGSTVSPPWPLSQARSLRSDMLQVLCISLESLEARFQKKKRGRCCLNSVLSKIFGTPRRPIEKCIVCLRVSGRGSSISRIAVMRKE